jgi:hypothetical protein
MCEKFAPVLTGLGVKRATEAAAQPYIHDVQHGEGVLKMDFSNAFNSVYRHRIF